MYSVHVCQASEISTTRTSALEVMPTEGTFQSGESVCFEAEAMPLYALLCIAMELLPGRIVARGV